MKKIAAVWNKLPDALKRVLHTAWQLALPTLLAHLLLAHSSKDVQSSFVAAGAVFLASVKALVVKGE